MTDLTLPWCTYETCFSNGLFYRGKGQTAKVLNGSYTGSGIRYRLALIYYADRLESGEITTLTAVVSTHATEEEAYLEEETFVPITLLADPMCLNMHAGGTTGRYQTPGRLLRKIHSERRKAVLASKKARAKLKKAAEAAEMKELKMKLKNTTNGKNK